MATLLGGNRWVSDSHFSDDYIPLEDRDLSPLDDDYIPEKYRESEGTPWAD